MINDIVKQTEELGYQCQSVTPTEGAFFEVLAISPRGKSVSFIYDGLKGNFIFHNKVFSSSSCLNSKLKQSVKFIKNIIFQIYRSIWCLLCLPFHFCVLLIKAMNKKFFIHNALFLKEFISSPRCVGSVWPSSKTLSNKISALVTNKSFFGLVVELGAGTGVVTQALLKAGVSPERLLVVEKNPQLVQILRKKFEKLQILEGDAANLTQLVRSVSVLPVETIVSSLPLSSLGKNNRDAIFSQIKSLLHRNGQYIQYQYFGKNIVQKFYKKIFKLNFSTFVMRNIPPATVRAYSVI